MVASIGARLARALRLRTLTFQIEYDKQSVIELLCETGLGSIQTCA